MRLKSIKKFIGVLTALIVALSPMMVMASEATTDTNTQSEVWMKQYIVWKQTIMMKIFAYLFHVLMQQ